MSNVSATCSETGVLSPATPCECQAGYSGGDGVNCIACNAGMYKSAPGSGNCTSCPMFSEALSIASTECVCVKECAAGYYRSTASESLGECMQCPVDSNSTGGAVSECTCNDGLATADGSTTTTSARCDQCRTDYYRDGGCVRCPAMSGRVFSDNETTCTCNQGYRHPNGSVDTTTEDCVALPTDASPLGPGAIAGIVIAIIVIILVLLFIIIVIVIWRLGFIKKQSTEVDEEKEPPIADVTVTKENEF